MNREIKFRGLRSDGKGWVYGYFFVSRFQTALQYGFAHCIQVINPDNLTYECYEVIPESISQYTGLKDKNGVEIYEGDIVTVTHQEGFNWPQTHHDKGEVVYGDMGAFIVKCLKKGPEKKAKEISKRYFHLSFKPERLFEVIGNVYQNPELL